MFKIWLSKFQLEVQLTFYIELYGEHTSNTYFDQSWLKKNCEEKISINECTNAVKELKCGKTSGSDCLTSDYYQFFWEDIKLIAFNSLIYCFQLGNEFFVYYLKVGKTLPILKTGDQFRSSILIIKY